MARGNKIVVTPDPKGRFLEVIVSGTPKPGTCMELKQSAGVDANGKLTYEPAGTTAASGEEQGMSADGDNLPIAVLTEIHSGPGRDATTAFVSGERGMLYFPLPGDEINVLYANQSGTADDILVGDKLMVDDGTGKLLTSTGVECEPFIALEAQADPTADVLLWCMATGR